MIGLRYDEKLWQYVKPFLSDTGTLRTDRQTDGRTDRIAISISHVSVLTRDKNRFAVRFRREPLGTYSTSRTPSWIFFTARRVCIAWTMPWQDVYLSVLPSVCLSARLSHVRFLSVRLHVSSNFFHRQVARPFLVFPYQTEWQYSVGDHPPNGDVECKAGMKNRDFRPISRFISGMMQDTVIVTMEGE